jgi:hypothetical protein
VPFFMMSSEPQLGQRRKGGMLDIGDHIATIPILSTLYEKALPSNEVNLDLCVHGSPMQGNQL